MRLFAYLPGAKKDGFDISVAGNTLSIRGELSSGNAVETNEVTFPIQITRAGPACPAGQVVVSKEGACFNPGQNGQKPTCEVAPTP